MSCYCRGAGHCDDCGGHTCTGGCTCNHDGAPQTQELVTAGWAPTTSHHEQERTP